MPDLRTPERIRHHYVIEKELAAKLRAAPRSERLRLYSAVYNELFERVNDHPQLSDQETTASSRRAQQKIRLIRRFTTPETRFLEIGSGDGELSRIVAEEVAHLDAVEVSAEIAKKTVLPENARVYIVDGVTLPFENDRFDCMFSNQVLEHFHPDDAAEHLREAARVLKPGGWYVCITPSHHSGPHDVSRHFDDEATGLHLKEYTIAELRRLAQTFGFDRIRLFAGGKGFYFPIPLILALATEKILYLLPRKLGKILARFYPIRAILGINIALQKRG